MRSRFFGLMIALAGCGSHVEPATPAETNDTPEVEAPAAPAGPRVENENYVLEVSASPAGYVSGQASSVVIELHPRNGWHVNVDTEHPFPHAIELSGPSELGLAKPRLERADAVAFDEEHFRFEAALTPTAAGERTVDANVRFAICSAENCLPIDEHLALPIVVR